MSFIVVIPARHASTRLPGKMLSDVAGKPLVAHAVDRANESSASRVIVATDDRRIKDALVSLDCETYMTRADHLSGSDRLTEVVSILDLDDEQIVVNLQGDEPLLPPELINQVANRLAESPDAAMATAAHPIVEAANINDPNIVKVVFNLAGKALYFSRAPIPFDRDNKSVKAWHHIGIYAYRAGFLRRYQSLLPSALEQAESLEQLRVLDNGETIVVETVDYDVGIGVDTKDDLARVRELFEQAKGA